uniref:Uncharacterized protein n=1 Tax=candidate division WOR-3 bacterium TaxID=2052148 RepID=A0A7C3J5D1_UNCW3
MIFEFIVIIVSIILLVFHLEFFVIILLSLLFIHRIFVTLKKDNKPNIHKKYFITPSSLSSKLLSELLNSNVLEGEFHILSKESIDSHNEFTLKNIQILKKKGNVIYSNIQNRITDILSYSYKNNLILIVFEEKIPKNLMKMFNIKIIDLSFVEEEKKEDLKSMKLKVKITEKVEDGYYCKRKDLKDVILFLKNGEYPLNIGEEIDVEVENIFETPQKRIIYVRRSY